LPLPLRNFVVDEVVIRRRVVFIAAHRFFEGLIEE
jgi:hypothetical protein